MCILIKNKATKWTIETELNPIQIIQAIDKIKLSAFEKLNKEIIVSKKWKGYAISPNVIVKKGGI
ncbi:hypothetical protein FACS189449_08170 [Alphaproteobacteria bacterium]|nr:hypothetical protein FACS189449_08170 [Alphaproteobacteria bacterium]